MICHKWKQIVIEQLEKHVKPHFVIVFGSYAMGIAQDNSDLDIAYYADNQLTNYERFLLQGDIAEQCQTEVDLVDIKEVDTVFAAQIYSKGEAILVNNNNVFIKERMKTLSMYVTLNDQRAEIVQAIEKRGTIYGP